MKQSNNRGSNASRADTNRLPWLQRLCWLSLLAALVVGLVWRQPDHRLPLQGVFPGAEIQRLAEASGEQYRVTLGNQVMTVSLGQGQGYGGPLVSAVILDERGRVQDTRLVSHKETPGYLFRFADGKFLRQFRGHMANSDFLLGQGVDALSGATLTSRGLTSSIRQGAHQAAAGLGLTRSWAEPELHFGLKELLAVLLFVAAALSRRVPRAYQGRYNRVLSAASVVLIGYWLNSALSIGLIGSMLLGYFPSPAQQPLWYIMLAGTLGAILLLGRNLYCSQLCPFHQIQKWLQRISGLNLALHPALKRRAKWLANGLLWLSLMLIFLSRTPAMGAYEPFSMLFSLDGLGVQWYLLPLSLLGAFVVSDFWCRLFCPLGRFLTLMLELRARGRRFLSGARIIGRRS
ncbi:FMN-binding protein [Ferrimonas sp. SCSIO 43195]|uniref:FMN-binding protein n=1 Tax=Ferrimonas sp. SCSIO 43195 TaxID=2822844 RepID=UPI0020756E79|nr:FMN-binding protein [Ferrimonas sp. SCSIO 43195]USD38726.1 FMN-binding protein [Ferrimonas sp. SCSIO 43195]